MIRFTSIRKFKGLESPVILITDVDPTHPTSTPQDLHVGTSRARHALVVLRTQPETVRTP
jgi:UvrD-like helicase C-terminal domain